MVPGRIRKSPFYELRSKGDDLLKSKSQSLVAQRLKSESSAFQGLMHNSFYEGIITAFLVSPLKRDTYMPI